MYYKDLEVWKEAIVLVTNIYKVTATFPDNERFGITNQLRRCVVSIPSNIAEGTVKHSDKETLRFLDMALGSLAELDTQLIISEQLGLTTEMNSYFEQVARVRALLSGLIKFYQKRVNETT